MFIVEAFIHSKKTIILQIGLDELKNELREIVKEELLPLIPSEEKLIKITEVMEMFNPPVTRATLAKWTREGKLKGQHIGRSLFYKRSEVLESLKTLKRWGR